MAKQNTKKNAASGTKREVTVALGQEKMIKKDQQTLERLFAQSLARRFPIYEISRCTIGFLRGMVSQALTDHIADFLRGYGREMQNAICDSIRIHILWGEIDLVGVKHVDDELEKIFDWYDEDVSF